MIAILWLRRKLAAWLEWAVAVEEGIDGLEERLEALEGRLDAVDITLLDRQL